MKVLNEQQGQGEGGSTRQKEDGRAVIERISERGSRARVRRDRMREGERK